MVGFKSLIHELVMVNSTFYILLKELHIVEIN